MDRLAEAAVYQITNEQDSLLEHLVSTRIRDMPRDSLTHSYNQGMYQGFERAINIIKEELKRLSDEE